MQPLAVSPRSDSVRPAVAPFGGVLGGLIGSAIAPYPVYEAPVVVERYAPAPMVVERYVREPVYVERYERPVVVYRGGHRHWRDHDRRHHERHRRHWDDD